MNQEARILLIEDDKAQAESLIDIFENEGYKVEQAKNGQEALTKIRAAKYSVAILDLLLPDVPGIAVLKSIKNEQPRVEVIILTGHASLESAIDAVNLGAYGFRIKPVPPEELIFSIRHAMERQRLQVEAERLQLQLSGLASISAEALNEKIRALDELAFRDQELSALVNGTHSIVESIQPNSNHFDKVLCSLIAMMGPVVNASYVSLLLVEKDKSFRRAAEWTNIIPPPKVLNNNGTLANTIFRTGEIVHVEKAMDDYRSNPVLIEAGLRSYSGIPVKIGAQVMAIIFAHSKYEGAFVKREKALKVLADQVSVIIYHMQELKTQALLAQEWEHTVESMSDGIAIMDRECRVLKVNSAQARMLNKDKKELLGQRLCPFIHGTAEPVADCSIKQAVEKCQINSQVFQVTLLGKTLEITADPIIGPEGCVERVVHLVREV